MSIGPGDRVGPYQVVSPLGEGGMGQVYRARDSKLKRDVAIKVLPAAVSADQDRLARFQREAEVLAALNHPHIAHIHGLEESDGTIALVMELVEGEDLSQRIARGPIPIDETLPIAIQIAEALEAAHEQGIIHRDLKPANIKVRADGTVKVLDFGLAKAVEPSQLGATQASPLRDSPTITSPAVTAAGLILGTAAYMSPEQAKGKAVDKRADIWAFGCVLFEMVSGTRSFQGEDVSDLLVAVLSKDVDYGALPRETPPFLITLIRSCLERDPRNRLRDVGDARLMLTRRHGPNDDVPAGQRQSSALLPWAIATLAVIAAIAASAAALWPRPPSSPAGEPLKFVVPAESATRFLAPNPILSADGRLMVLSDGSRLNVRELSNFSARPLPGTEGADFPFLSPDAKFVGFYTNNKLRRAALAGGDPIDIAPVDGDSPGAGWGYDGRIYFTRGWNDAAIVSVPADGGAEASASTLDRSNNERGHWWPEPLPDGRHILFTVWYAAAGLSESKIAVLDVRTGQHRILMPGAMPRYGGGHLIYYRAGLYYVVAFDPESLTTTGEPRPILPDALGVAPEGNSGLPVTFAMNGTVAYVAGELHPETVMTWVHLDGRQEPTTVKLRTRRAADLSPDGQRVAFGLPQGGSSQIAILDLRSGSEQRLRAAGMNLSAVWNPDGQRLAFNSIRKGDFDAYVQRIDGSAEEPLDISPADVAPVAWLPDGQRLLAKDWQPDGATSLFVMDTVHKTREPLVAGDFQKNSAEISPDGKWLALLANPSGVWHVYVRSMTGSTALQQLSSSAVAAEGLQWSQRGNRLFYWRDSTLVGATLEEHNGRWQATEKSIATLRRGSLLVGVAPDGERALVAIPVDQTSTIPPGIRIIVNAVAEWMK